MQLVIDPGFVPDEVDVENEVCSLTVVNCVDSTVFTAAPQSDAIFQQTMEIARKKVRVVIVGALGMNLKRSPFYE